MKNWIYKDLGSYCCVPLFVLLIASASVVSQPKIKIIGKSSFSFGSIYEGSHPAHKIKITNVGASTLQVKNINSPCECSQLSLSSYSIAPHDTAMLTVTFRSDGYQGKVKKHVSITSNDPERSTVIIPFTVEVNSLLIIEPQFIYVKNDQIGISKFPSIIITNMSREKVTIRKIYDPTNIIEVMLNQKIISPKESVRADIQVHPVGQNSRKGEIEIIIDSRVQPGLKLKYFIEGTGKSTK